MNLQAADHALETCVEVCVSRRRPVEDEYVVGVRADVVAPIDGIGPIIVATVTVPDDEVHSGVTEFHRLHLSVLDCEGLATAEINRQ